MFLARDAEFCGSSSSTSCVIQLAWHGDNPTAPVLPWEPILTGHFHKQAMNLNYDVEQGNISNNCHRKSLKLNSPAVCRVNCRSYAFAVLQITQGTARWNRDSQCMTSRKGRSSLDTHPTLLLSQCSWLRVATIYNRTCLNRLSSLAQENDYVMELSASLVSGLIHPQENPKSTRPSGREMSGCMQLGTEEGQGDRGENKWALFCCPTWLGSHL